MIAAASLLAVLAMQQAPPTPADSLRREGVAAYRSEGPRAAMRLWRRSLSLARASGDSAGVAAVLGNIGAAWLEQGALDSAERYLERARSLGAASRDTRVEANALDGLAGVRQARGDYTGARERYGVALEKRQGSEDTRGAAADHNNLGLLAQSLGDPGEARREFETARDLNRRAGRDDVAATNDVNLAGLASDAGEFAAADSLYRCAIAVWRERGQRTDLATALRGLGQLQLRRGDYPAARATLEAALTILDQTGPLPEAIAAREELAGAVAAMGELQGGIDLLRLAQRQADSAHAPFSVRAGVLMVRGDLAVLLNDRDEAERLYAGAAQFFRAAADRTGEAAAQAGIGLLLLDHGEAGAAQNQLAMALRSNLAARNRRGAALVRLWLGEAALLRGDTILARRHFARSAAEFTAAGDPVASAAALGESAALELAAVNALAADSLFRRALGRLGGRLVPEVSWRLHAGLAAALRAERQNDGAVEELHAALTDIEGPAGTLALPERRSAFLADKLSVYENLALLDRSRGRIGDAFEASERLHARAMLESLGRSRIAVPPGVPGQLAEREQDLRRRIGELMSGIEPRQEYGSEALRGPDVSAAATASLATLDRAQTDYANLLLEMREGSPRHLAIVRPRVAGSSDVARRLGEREAFVEYLVGDTTSLAFVITRDTMAVIDLNVDRRELARVVEFARATLASPRQDALWRTALRRLDQYLVAPLTESGLLTGKSRLIVVPHAELHYLPFAALLDDAGHYLVERYELATTPSASVWLAVGARPGSTGHGVLALAPRPDLLPASAREVEVVSRATGDAEVLVGAAASEEAFRREAPSRRVVHLATYGVLNRQNPLFSHIVLSPGGAFDGRLDVHEVFGLDFHADLVVLSACQTGVGSGLLADVPAGDDWVGLTQAFLAAGARNVVATLWPVEDRATADLMERFYGAWAVSPDPVAALAAAQRAAIASAGSASPFGWAGFVVVGGAR